MDFIKEVEKHLDLPTIKKAEVLKELTTHCAELKEELTASGLSTGQMEEEVIQRMGKPQEVAARITATHCSASWKTALLCVAPFIVSMIISLLKSLYSHIPANVVTVCAGLVFIAFSIREFKRDRRPLWLATWWAASLRMALSIAYIFNLCTIQPEYYVHALSICAISLMTLLWMRRFYIGTFLVSVAGVIYPLINVSREGNITSRILPVIGTINFLTYSVVLLLYSKLIFQSHRLGSGAQASLFLLTFFGLPFTYYQSFSIDNLVYPAQSVSMFACAVLVIWFVHQSKHTEKIIALSSTIVCMIMLIVVQRFCFMCSYLHLQTHITGELIGLAFFYAIHYSPILIPLLSDYKKQPNRRQLA